MPEKIELQKIRCQSCGMPLSAEFGNHGTESDGTASEHYCSICCQNGQFTQPNQTLAEMVASSIDNMISEVGMSHEQATQLANDFIPTLKRWR